MSLVMDWNDKEPGLEGPEEAVEPDNPEDEAIDEKELGEKLFSQPDMAVFIPTKKRRASRVQVPAEEIEQICNGYVKWRNSLGQEEYCKILYAWILEKNSNDIVYIMIDAVYVDEQSGTHVKGIKPEMKKNKTRISHWNIAVEVDGVRYALTALTRLEAYQQLLAFLLTNNLMGRYFTFMIDGETKIFDDIQKYFGNHPKTIFLDWYHVEEKVVQKLSSAIIHKMVPDPRTQALPKSEQKNTSLSNLYARKLLSILWVGNVKEGIEYCRNIDPSIVKNQKALDDLVGYLEGKGRYITCYALRKRAGLRNSSNGSENVNEVLVSKRQKDDDESWREVGSSSASNMACLYANGEEGLWFKEGKVTFDLSYKKASIAKKKAKSKKKADTQAKDGAKDKSNKSAFAH